MTYPELLTRGRQLTEVERAQAIRKLLHHEHAAALLAWLEDYIKKGYVESIAHTTLAAHHGNLEHCAGSICAVIKIQEDLQQLLLQPQPTRPRPD